MHIIQKLIEASGREVRDYTGRGVYNKKCVGVVCNSIGEFLSEVFLYGLQSYGGYNHLTDNETEDLANGLASIQTDSMGMGSIIVYFPDINYTERKLKENKEEFEENEEE